MKNLVKNSISVLALSFVSAIALSAPTVTDYSLTPLSLTQENTPLVMLAMSRDHQLFYKAYPDYTDLDGDNILDTRYLDTFDYSGYFDPKLCYQYNESKKYFEVSPATDVQNGKRINEVTGKPIMHSCLQGWSGNFLNWSTMSRMDVLRNVLYGGLRVVDDTTPTTDVTLPSGEVEKIGRAVLERAYLPVDVHSFGKLMPNYDATSTPLDVPLKHLMPPEFAKHEGITICSTSDTNNDPILRIVKGLYPSWMMKAFEVCTFDGQDGAPNINKQIDKDMIIRVEVCADPQELSSSRCRAYSDGTDKYVKPVGLLQKFSEDGRIDFGLMTGTWHRNNQGGVVRSQIGKLVNNTDSSKDEVNLNDGSFIKSRNGIISTLDKIKITNYSAQKYQDCNEPGILIAEVKARDAFNRSCSNWGNPIAEIYYEALRYFSGESKALEEFSGVAKMGNKNYTDNDYISGINTEFTWTDPLNTSNYCAKCAIILISSGPSSFESDIGDIIGANSGDVKGLTSLADLNKLTDKVGDTEYGFASKTTNVIAMDDGLCIPKDIGGGSSNLSDELGLCPDAPQAEGNYHTAGLAFLAHTTDLRNDYNGVQMVNTYAIELADNVPTIDVKVNDKPITIVPACQAKNGGNAYEDNNYVTCSLTDIRVESMKLSPEGNLINAAFIISWEDSMWGNDFDMDAIVRMEVCTALDANCTKKGGSVINADTIKIDHQIVFSSAGFKIRAAYSIAGTTADGLKRDWSVKDNTDAINFNQSWDTAAAVYSRPLRKTNIFKLNSGTVTTQTLNNPLYLAAKYGGFNDKNGNGTPDYVEEWDALINDTGTKGSDGIPDNYYKVRNPSTLEDQLGRVFNSIIERIASGSNAAVVANRAAGNGAIYQAVYYPKLTKGNNSVSWVGQLHSLFVDDAGLIREDTNGNALLDDYPIVDDGLGNFVPGDYIVQIFYNESLQDTYFQRYALLGKDGDASLIAIPVGIAQDMDDLKPIWNAAEALALVPDANIPTQRTYSDKAQSGRFVSTSYQEACDTTGDGDLDSLCVKQIDFSSANYEKLAGYLGLSATQPTETVALINYIRGLDMPTARSRKYDFNNDNVDETWRLGDIIHSTPIVVERPTEQYDTFFGDNTYKAFKEQYNSRRRMIYAGANDGMIHAFNGGYWNSVCNGFLNKSVETVTNPATECVNDANGHALGTELWSYVPRNLLGHLRWQIAEDYPHLFYVDGEPQSFDARIFDADDDHPNGWGTILVVPMRQGGAAIDVDHDNDIDTPDQTLRSSIVVLDITNPEKAPVLIAEINDENLGMTLTKPTLTKKYVPSSASYDGVGNLVSTGFESMTTNNWQLVFGSGPYPHTAGNASVSSSSQNGYFYSYDLKSKKLFKKMVVDAANSFFVGFESIDWDNDGSTDAVYFGSVKNTVANQSGELFRWNLTDATGYIDVNDNSDLVSSKMFSMGKPMVAKPTLTRSSDSDRWVHFGTGRYFVNDDRTSENQQAVYGVKEPRTTTGFTYGPVDATKIFDSGEVYVYETGKITNKQGNDVVIDTTIVSDYEQLIAEMTNLSGWTFDLSNTSTTPAGRNLREGLIYQDQLIFTEYIPSGNQCDVNGRSSLHVVSWATGTALPYNALGKTEEVDLDGDGSVDAEVVSSSDDLGVGEFSGVTVFETNTNITLINDETIITDLKANPENAGNYLETGVGGNCILVQASTGEMVCRRTSSAELKARGRQSWREVNILF